MAVKDDPQLKSIADRIAAVVADLSAYEAGAGTAEMRAAQTALRQASNAYNTLTSVDPAPYPYYPDYY